MIGTPTERTRADVVDTIDYSIRLDPDFVMFNVLTPFPGTTLYDEQMDLERGVQARREGNGGFRYRQVRESIELAAQCAIPLGEFRVGAKRCLDVTSFGGRQAVIEIVKRQGVFVDSFIHRADSAGRSCRGAVFSRRETGPA